MHNLQHFPIKLIYFFVGEDCNHIQEFVCLIQHLATHLSTRIATDDLIDDYNKAFAGNPLVYEDCNGDKPQILRNIYTGNPLVYKDCNRKDERDTADRRDWQPTCLRGLQQLGVTRDVIANILATHLSTRITTAKYS